MYRRNVFGIWGIAAAALCLLSSNVASQAEQKSTKELISGSWTLLIADNVRRDGGQVPGFGPLPKGTARFGTDGRYSLEVIGNADGRPALRSSGTYSLDDAGKTLTLKVDESSIPDWRGTTQTGTVKYVLGDYLGWTNSVPLVASADFVGTELVWARAK